MRASVDVTLSARGSCRCPFLEAFKISCRGPFLDIVIILLLAHSYFSTKSASYDTVRRVRQNSGNEEILPVSLVYYNATALLIFSLPLLVSYDIASSTQYLMLSTVIIMVHCSQSLWQAFKLL